MLDLNSYALSKTDVRKGKKFVFVIVSTSKANKFKSFYIGSENAEEF